MEFSSAHSMRWLSLSTVSRLNWNLECWFLWMEEKQRTRRKTHGAGMRTNKKHNTHLTPGPGILGHSGERQTLSLLCHSPPPRSSSNRKKALICLNALSVLSWKMWCTWYRYCYTKFIYANLKGSFMQEPWMEDFSIESVNDGWGKFWWSLH